LLLFWKLCAGAMIPCLRTGPVRGPARPPRRRTDMAGVRLALPELEPQLGPSGRKEQCLSIHVALNHVTHYRYDRRVSLGPQLIRLRPAPHSRTRILSYSQRITPAEHFINWQQDPEANYLARVVVPDKTSELRIEIDLVAEMAVLNPFDFFLDEYAGHFPFDYQPAERRELAPYLVTQAPTPRFGEYLAGLSRARVRTIDFLVGLNQQLAKDIRYLIRMEPGVQCVRLVP